MVETRGERGCDRKKRCGFSKKSTTGLKEGGERERERGIEKRDGDNEGGM